MLVLIALLLTKHLIIDYPLQPKWMYANKGTWGHPGGIVHALLHGGVTYIILGFWDGWQPINILFFLILSLAEAVIHYVVDWGKMNIGAAMNWKPTNAEAFWWLLGLDQWLHNMCYVIIVALVTT